MKLICTGESTVWKLVPINFTLLPSTFIIWFYTWKISINLFCCLQNSLCIIHASFYNTYLEILVIYRRSFRGVIYETILEYDWHSKGQQKDGYGKWGPTAWWKKGPSDKGHGKAKVPDALFLPQFLLVSFAFWPPRSLWDWSDNTCCKGGQLGNSWAQLAIQESTGPDGMHLSALKEIKHCGDQGRFLITGKTPMSHPPLGGQEEDSGSCKPHLRPSESYRANLLEAIAISIYQGWLQHCGQRRGRQWMLYALTSSRALTQSPFVSLKKNWGDEDWISRLQGNWLHGRTQRVLMSSTKSKRLPVTCSFPQRSTLGPTLFIVFINDLGDGTECTFSELANDIKLEGAVNTLESTAAFR